MPVAFLKHAIVRLPCHQWVTVANQKKKVFRFAARSQPRHRHNCILGSRLKAVHNGFPVCWRDSCKAFYRIHTETILYSNQVVGSTNTHIHTHTHAVSWAKILTKVFQMHSLIEGRYINHLRKKWSVQLAKNERHHGKKCAAAVPLLTMSCISLCEKPAEHFSSVKLAPMGCSVNPRIHFLHWSTVPDFPWFSDCLQRLSHFRSHVELLNACEMATQSDHPTSSAAKL